MKAFDVSDLIRGVPELYGADPFIVKNKVRTIGVFYPLRASRHLSPTTRRELWVAVVGSADAQQTADAMSDDEILRDLEERGKRMADGG